MWLKNLGVVTPAENPVFQIWRKADLKGHFGTTSSEGFDFLRFVPDPLGSKARILDDLVAWIQAQLHQPIQLQDLVQQSGYSQRSLRNAFHERFGCGPVQWIRSQRLSAARARLLDPNPRDTVSQVAGDCGYQHLSQFSRDFQLAYGIRPSELLREGRRERS